MFNNFCILGIADTAYLLPKLLNILKAKTYPANPIRGPILELGIAFAFAECIISFCLLKAETYPAKPIRGPILGIGIDFAKCVISFCLLKAETYPAKPIRGSIL